MRTRSVHSSPATLAAAVPLVLLGALAIAACGGMSFPVPSTTPTWPPGASPSPAITYPPQPATTAAFIPGTEGWFFEPTVDIEVTDLGWYDDGQDGLTQSHPVGIFDASDEKLLVESRVEPDSPLDGAFRWASVEPPLVLRAGHTYVIAAYTHSPFDPEVVNPKDASLAPELRYLYYRESEETKLIWGFPHRKVSNTFLSANFKFRPVSAASPTP